MSDAYRGLAADYDWIFDDGELAGGAAINQPATARLLRRIGPGAHVLDAACGTGIDAAVPDTQAADRYAVIAVAT